MYAFLKWQYIQLLFMLVALVAMGWGLHIRHPFVRNSPVRRSLIRARKRDYAVMYCLAVALVIEFAHAL